MNTNLKKTITINRAILALPLLPRRLLLVLATVSGAVLLHAQSVIQFATSITTIPETTPQVTLVVTRTNEVDTVVSVDYTSSDGTALAGLDYTAVSGTLIFDAGVSNLSITVPILNDGSRESAELFRVSPATQPTRSWEPRT